MAVTRRVLGGYSEDPTLDPTSYDQQPEQPQPGPGTPTTPDTSGASTQGASPPPVTPITVPPKTVAPPTGGSAEGLPHGTSPAGYTPQYAPGTNPATMNFGDLTSPTNWMGMVGNTSQLDSWINSILGPSVKPSDVNYWETAIKGKPGANATEQAGSAAYWTDRMQHPENHTESSTGGGSLPDANLPGNPDFSGLSDYLNNPLSKATDTKLQELIDNNGQVKDTNGQIEALNLENARGMADRARRAEMSGVDSTLANRGVLDQYDPAGGQHAASAGYVERNDVAPLFSDAVRSYMINDNNNASQRLQGALSDATTRQGVLSNIALQSLAQNTAFDEFAATYGLQKDQILEQLKSGNDSNLINLLEIFLQQNGQLNQGFH